MVVWDAGVTLFRFLIFCFGFCFWFFKGSPAA
jgi:hypothetical protein